MPSSTLTHTHTRLTSPTQRIYNLFSCPMWNPHPAKETACQKPSPFKGKAAFIVERSSEAPEPRRHMKLY